MFDLRVQPPATQLLPTSINRWKPLTRCVSAAPRGLSKAAGVCEPNGKVTLGTSNTDRLWLRETNFLHRILAAEP